MTDRKQFETIVGPEDRQRLMRALHSFAEHVRLAA